jgi:hypothetical protein
MRVASDGDYRRVEFRPDRGCTWAATGARTTTRIRRFLADRPLTHWLQQARILTALFVPLTTMHALLSGTPTDANDYWVQTTSHQHTFIDRTTTRIEGSAARRRQAQHVACLRPRRDVGVTPGGCGNNLSAGREKEMACRSARPAWSRGPMARNQSTAPGPAQPSGNGQRNQPARCNAANSPAIRMGYPLLIFAFGLGRTG